MGNITGSFRSLDRDTLTALQQAARSGQKIEATEVDAIEQAAGRDGNVSSGERELVAQLREATRDGREVRDLQLAGFDPNNQEVSFDVSFGANNTGTATVETPENYVANLTRLEPATRTAFLTSMSRSGLSPVEQKQLASVLNRTGTPEQVASTTRFMSTSQPAQVRDFGRQLLALSGPEQSAALEVSQLLSQNPAPANLESTLRTRMDSLPADRPPLTTAGRNGMAVGRALNALGVNLPSTNPRAPGVEDASGRLHNVVMGPYNSVGSAQRDYIRDMIRVGKAEGFQVTMQVANGTDLPALRNQIVADMAPEIADVAELNRHLNIVEAATAGYVWGEDNKWITGEGTIVTTPSADRALDQAQAFVGRDTGVAPGTPGSEGHHTAGLPPHDPNGLVSETSNQGAVSQRGHQQSASDLAAATGRTVRETRTYNEGGNMLVGTFPNGDPYAVIGRDGLITSTFQLEQRFAARAADVPEFDPARVNTQIASMGLDQPFASLPPAQQTLIDQTADRLRSAGESFPDQAAARSRATQFLARTELTKDVFAQDVGVARDNLIFVAQPEFHIDMHMRPLGPGQFMINDFDANERLLRDALGRATAGSWEATEIQGMIDHNSQMRSVMAPVMTQIEQQLREGGLEVIRAPGVMEGPMSNPDPRIPADERNRRVNFMNAVPATRPGSNQQFYITNFTSLPSMRAAYENYLRTERGIEQVYWVGDEGGSERTKSASERSLDLDGGLDCRENH